MKGITIDTYRTYCRRKGRPEPTEDDLRNITQAEWSEIFKTMYWDRWQADSINNQSVANILVDWVWASGVYGIKIPQRILGVDQDGIVGPATLRVLNSTDPAALFANIRNERVAFVERIVQISPSQSRFIRGWLNRINDFKFVDR